MTCHWDVAKMDTTSVSHILRGRGRLTQGCQNVEINCQQLSLNCCFALGIVTAALNLPRSTAFTSLLATSVFATRRSIMRHYSTQRSFRKGSRWGVKTCIYDSSMENKKLDGRRHDFILPYERTRTLSHVQLQRFCNNRASQDRLVLDGIGSKLLHLQ